MDYIKNVASVLEMVEPVDGVIKISADVRDLLVKLLRGQERWISVKDRLPEPGMSVIIYGTPKEDPEHTDGKIAITCMSERNYFNSQIKTEPYWIMPWQYFSFDYTITHWMPLPEPPKEDERDD